MLHCKKPLELFFIIYNKILQSKAATAVKIMTFSHEKPLVMPEAHCSKLSIQFTLIYLHNFVHSHNHNIHPSFYILTQLTTWRLTYIFVIFSSLSFSFPSLHWLIHFFLYCCVRWERIAIYSRLPWNITMWCMHFF